MSHYNRYIFQVDDQVIHRENGVVGVITKLLTIDEDNGEPEDRLDVNCCWYNILWDDKKLGSFEGFESQVVLLPYHY